MRKELNIFVRAVLFFAALCMLLLTSVVLFGPPLSRNTFVEALKAKHARLDSVASPRIIIIGGSNAAFGINSPELEKAFHLPVVNMALHASLGYRFMVNEVIDAIGKGDVLLVVPEHSQYLRPDKLDDILYNALDRYPEALRYVDPLDRPHVVADLAVRKLQAAWHTLVAKDIGKYDPIYRSDGFNAEGDVISHLHVPSPGIADSTAGRYDRIRTDPAFVRITNKLVERAKECGAVVVLCWPSHARSRANTHVCDDLLRTARTLAIATAGDPCDYVFDDSLFFDTPYHLTASGREIRTQLLLRDLRQADPQLGR